MPEETKKGIPPPRRRKPAGFKLYGKKVAQESKDSAKTKMETISESETQPQQIGSQGRYIPPHMRQKNIPEPEQIPMEPKEILKRPVVEREADKRTDKINLIPPLKDDQLHSIETGSVGKQDERETTSENLPTNHGKEKEKEKAVEFATEKSEQSMEMDETVQISRGKSLAGSHKKHQPRQKVVVTKPKEFRYVKKEKPNELPPVKIKEEMEAVVKLSSKMTLSEIFDMPEQKPLKEEELIGAGRNDLTSKPFGTMHFGSISFDEQGRAIKKEGQHKAELIHRKDSKGKSLRMDEGMLEKSKKVIVNEEKNNRHRVQKRRFVKTSEGK